MSPKSPATLIPLTRTAYPVDPVRIPIPAEIRNFASPEVGITHLRHHQNRQARGGPGQADTEQRRRPIKPVHQASAADMSPDRRDHRPTVVTISKP
jgi:hypothetical protein